MPRARLGGSTTPRSLAATTPPPRPPPSLSRAAAPTGPSRASRPPQAAQWLLDGVSKPPHGAHFRRWADRFERRVPGMAISTCHSYDIHYKFRYGCQGACGAEIGRQSKSIDLARQRCGRCGGALALLGAFNRDGTPAQSREPSAFAKYVKEHFSELKKARPAASHGQIMSALGERWRAEGATPAKATPTAAKDTAPAAEEENLCSNLRSALDLAAADA